MFADGCNRACTFVGALSQLCHRNARFGRLMTVARNAGARFREYPIDVMKSLKTRAKNLSHEGAAVRFGAPDQALAYLRGDRPFERRDLPDVMLVDWFAE